MVIDSTCMVFQSVCGRQGACLQYDAETFRARVHLFGVGIKLLAVLMYSLGWYITARAEKAQNKILMEKKIASNTEANGTEMKPLMNTEGTDTNHNVVT